MGTKAYELRIECRKAEANVLKQAQKLADTISKVAIISGAVLAVLFIIWRNI